MEENLKRWHRTSRSPGGHQAGWWGKSLAPSDATPPHEAVRWLLQFVEQDLSSLSTAALQEHAVKALGVMGQPVERDETIKMERADRNRLSKWQAAACDGLKGYLHVNPFAGWRFKVTVSGHATFYPHRLVGGKWVGLRNQRIAYEQEPRAVNDTAFFSWCALQAVLAVGPRLRVCKNADCRRPFLAERRQTFCTRLCGDRVRMAKYLRKLKGNPERKAEALARRKELYAEKIRKRLGARVNVGRVRPA